jgi:hypothetical protein
MKNKIFIALITLALASLACSIFIGGPDYPATTVPVSTADAQSLQDQSATAIANGVQTGTITLQITEAQLTSYLAAKLGAQTDPFITDPQVLLRNGQLQVFGKAHQGMFTANVSITANVTVDNQGKPKIEITQTDFGPLPAPQGLNDAVSAFVAEAFTGSLGPAATGFRLQTVSIADGVMTIVGQTK